MKRVEIEMFSESVNCPVVRMPERMYPGVVLQGDSLAILRGMAEEVIELCQAGDRENLAAAAEMLREKLAGYVSAYEQAMEEHGLELPYSKRK
jgi:hypothetical protein